MNKLSLDALRERAEAVASEDLLVTISGGTKNDCHPEPKPEKEPQRVYPDTGSSLGDAILIFLGF